MSPYALLDPAVAALHHVLVLVAAALPVADPGLRAALALVALIAPVAMGLYLLVSTAWTVAERRLLVRLLPAT